MRHYPTFSIRFLFVVMCIFCTILAATFYLAKIPIVREEVYTLFGKAPPPDPGGGRGSWLVFLLFTYISPLLLAATMYAISLLNSKQIDATENDDDFDPLA